MWWPSDSHSAAACSVARTQSGCTALPVGEAVRTATRNPFCSAPTAAANEGPRRGGAQ